VAWVSVFALARRDRAQSAGIAAPIPTLASPNRMSSSGPSGPGSVQAGPTRLAGPWRTAPARRWTATQTAIFWSAGMGRLSGLSSGGRWSWCHQAYGKSLDCSARTLCWAVGR